MHDSCLATGVIFIIIVIVPYSLVYINLYELMREMFRSLAAVSIIRCYSFSAESNTSSFIFIISWYMIRCFYNLN